MYKAFFKRFIDFFGSIIFIVILFPILFLLAMVLFFDLREVPLFVQKRPGKNEKIFSIVKFKTMKTCFEADGKLMKDNFRITGIGAFLRKYSIDELPELWNVLKGDMSFVGPRPLLVQYLPYYKESEKKRHSVRPGITGLAQISGRNYLTWDKRLTLDVKYVENISFLLDMNICLKTFFRVFRAKGVAVDPDVAESYLNEERSGKTNG